MFCCYVLKKKTVIDFEWSSVSILPSNPDGLSSKGSITGETFHWMFLFALLCFTFSLSSWFGFSSVFLHLYWILISYYELASLFHTAVFVLQETFILLNSASVILRKPFSLGDVMVGLEISGGAMLPWVVMWLLFLPESAHLELYCLLRLLLLLLVVTLFFWGCRSSFKWRDVQSSGVTRL